MLGGKCFNCSVVIPDGPGAFCLKVLRVSVNSVMEIGGKSSVSLFMSAVSYGLRMSWQFVIVASTKLMFCWS